MANRIMTNKEFDKVVSKIVKGMNTEERNLRAFDKETRTITQRRGEIYSHPSEDFAKITKLKAALPEFEDPRVRHVMEMICVKIARLSHTPDHVDSWIDIAGYARTGVMLIGKF